MTESEDIVWAIKNGDLDAVKQVVDKDPSLANKELKSRYPLHHAADYGQSEIIDYLLSKGAEVNKADKHGITPLLAAVYEGHGPCIKLLLAKGADKNGKSPNGCSYIEEAEKDDIKALLK